MIFETYNDLHSKKEKQDVVEEMDAMAFFGIGGE